MNNLLPGLMVFAAAAVFLLSHCAQGDAQNVQLGPSQQGNTQTTTITTKGIRPDGKPVDKAVSTNNNLPTEVQNPAGNFAYSGIPGEWLRKTGTEKERAKEQGKN